MNTAFDCYAPYKGDIQYRSQGSLIAFETGEAVAYGLFNAQERGTLFIGPGEKVYSGMVIGQNAKTDDTPLARLSESRSARQPISCVCISARPPRRRWRTKSSVCFVKKSAKCDFFLNLMKKSLTFRLWIYRTLFLNI